VLHYHAMDAIVAIVASNYCLCYPHQDIAVDEQNEWMMVSKVYHIIYRVQHDQHPRLIRLLVVRTSRLIDHPSQ
jgi:hypothetical protein